MPELNELNQVPEWARPKQQSSIIFDGMPRRYRAALLDGTFILDDNAIGQELQAQIFDYGWMNKPQYNGGITPTYEILFLDSSKIISLLRKIGGL
ncbi:MAG: hypothetical protein KME06_09540 [Kastovskya adunca ATA6-11-RM4]|jgi:hypothetical protein|nr:hypothetical protein [Kastovskya adunca ATA6-11-RM4]